MYYIFVVPRTGTGIGNFSVFLGICDPCTQSGFFAGPYKSDLLAALSAAPSWLRVTTVMEGLSSIRRLGPHSGYNRVSEEGRVKTVSRRFVPYELTPYQCGVSALNENRG